MIKMCQNKYITCNKCPTLGLDVGKMGGCACVGAERVQENFLSILL